jgi:osmoprotectant transport system substrate-binding protein
LLAQEIEAKTGMKVERRFYLAGSYIAQQALAAGRIDAYVEYTGTALTAILKQPVNKDPATSLATVTRLYRERYNVEVAPALGFENTFAMVVRGATRSGSTFRRSARRCRMRTVAAWRGL